MALVMPRRPRLAAAIPVVFALVVFGHPFSAGAQDYSGEYSPGWSQYMYQPSEGGLGGVWVGAEYLRWRIDGGRDVPPLATVGPASQPLDEVGRLDNPTTDVLFGNEELNADWRNGWRVYGGMWLDCCQCVGITGDYFDLDDDDVFVSESNANEVVARPFFNTELGEQDAQLVDVPNELWGEVEVASSDDFSGAGIAVQHRLLRCCDPCGPSGQLYMLAGYRHYRYDSDLVITENLLVLPGTTSPLVPGTTIFVQDRFSTENDFHGGEFGFSGAVQKDWWWIDGLAKFAIGSHRRRVKIDGQTINTVPGAGTAQFDGGLLTSEVTNIGEYADNTLAVIPQFRLGLGGQVTKTISVRAGYNVIFWNAVARAGSQLPPGLEVDPRNLPPVQPGGGAAPQFEGILGTPLIAHGVDLGVELTF